MVENTKIEWATHTFNPWMGCTKVSEGCAHCYAEELMDHRYGKVEWGPNGTRLRTSPANWRKPIQWNKAAKAVGERHRVFCASLADVFEDREELIPWRRDLLELIEKCRSLDWLVLTKRPENVLRMITEATGRKAKSWLRDCEHFWQGTSVEDQKTANLRINELLHIPAAVRFLSMEPLLGPVDLTQIPTGHWAYGHVDVMSGYLCGAEPDEMHDFDADPGGWVRRPAGEWERGECGIDWVIVGGESGQGARPCNVQWIRDIRDQCQAAGVPCFIKQLGKSYYEDDKAGARRRYSTDDPKGGDWENWPEDLRVREFPLLGVTGG